ncbi:hypothetical protein EMIT0215P_80093 [Pseudomonas serboccidentalis]
MRAWPIMSRSQRRSGLSICCFRTVSLQSEIDVLNVPPPSRAGSLLHLIAFPCRSEPARDAALKGTTNLPHRNHRCASTHQEFP